MLCLSYYCLYFLFNKIRDKSRTDSAWKRGGCVGGEGRNERYGGREMAQRMYAHMDKWIKKRFRNHMQITFLKELNLICTQKSACRRILNWQKNLNSNLVKNLVVRPKILKQLEETLGNFLNLWAYSFTFWV
jgi:hypothetical protein